MKKKKILKSILSIFLCVSMVLPSTLAMGSFEKVQAAETEETNLLVNGNFADDLADETSIYNNGVDDKAEAWQYWKDSSSVLPKTTLIENGITVEALGGTDRVTIQQKVEGVTAGKKYRLTGSYDVSSRSNGSFSIDVNGIVVITKNESKTNGWQTFSQDIIVPEGKTNVEIRIIVSKGAVLTASVKSFKLVEVEDETLSKAQTVSDNILKNSSFKDANADGKADDWRYYSTGSTEAASTLEENGIKIISDSTNGEQRLTLYQEFTTLKVGDYIFSGYYQVPSVGSGANDKLQLLATNGTTIEVNKVVTEWTYFEIECAVKKDGEKMKVEVKAPNNSNVTIKVKDLSLVRVFTGNEGTEYLKNGTFATDANNDGKADNWTYYKGSQIEATSSIGTDGITVNADSTSGTQRVTLYQEVKVPAGTYKFKGQIQIPSYTNGAVLVNGKVIEETSNFSTDKIEKVVEDWLSIEEELVVATDGNTIKIEFQVGTGGAANLIAKARNFSLVLIDEAPEPEIKNFIVNPTYEDANNDGKADNWNYYSDKGAAANYDSSPKDGVLTTKMNGTGTLVVHQTIKLAQEDVNKKYTFTGEIRGTDLTKSSYASFRIQLVDADNKGLGTKESPRLEATSTEWVPVVIEFEVPEESAGKMVDGIKIEQYINAGIKTVEFRNVKINQTGVMENIPEGDPINTLIFNGGYEKTATGMPGSWSLWQSTGGLRATSDRRVKYEGYSSLHIEEVTEGSNSRGSVHQTFTVTEQLSYLTGNAIKMSQWVKTEGFKGGSFSIRIHDPANTMGTGSVVATKTIPVESTQDWTYYEYILELPAYPLKTIKVEYLYDNCQGDVWVDNTMVSGYVRATGINVEAEPFVLKVGDEHQIKLNFTPSYATIQEVTFANSNDSVISVDKEGLIKALKNGVSVITITQADGVKKEVAVLVCDSKLDYNEEVTVSTKQNVKVEGTLPAGYTYALAAKPQNGTFIINNGNEYTYYPDKNFSGSDTVTLTVTKDGAQTLVVVPLTVTPVNGAPTCADFNVLTDLNKSVTASIVAVDPENDALTFEVFTQAEHGTLTIEGSKYTFVPEEGFTGYDNAVIKVTDGVNTIYANAKVYVAQTAEEILATVKKEHSRLLADNARFEELKELVKTDANAKAWYENIKAKYDKLLDDPTPVPYEFPDEARLNTQGSKDVVNMAFLYRMTGEKAYFDRACLELDSLCNKYPDWNPVHLLDTAMTANGVAIAYDWLYDTLKENNPQLFADVEKALLERGLKEAQKQFKANHMFVTNLNNWNYVCNGGFATVALAMAHHENEEINALAGEVLQRCYKSIQYGLPQYAPEGDSIEGLSYWNYGTNYLVSCLASISSATTVKNPFINAPGLYETAQYPIYVTGKVGSYNYSDNDTAPSVGYINLWFANEFNEPSYTWYHKDYVANGGGLAIYDLLYYYPEQYEADAPENLDRYYTSQGVTTMRHDFADDPNSSFLGFKGGTNGAAHGDLDIGSFIYDIYGIRWAFDFGKEDYNLPGYWELPETGTRWNYYRKNALGHNTLVINPEQGPNQTVGAYVGKIEQSINNVKGGYTILDMTEAYLKNAADVKRGFAYIDRTQVLIRDEFVLKAASDIFWQMHTEATVTVSEDGKVATLTKDGKSIELRLFDENGSDYKFETMAAKAYEGYGIVTADGENANEGVTKIYIKATDIQVGTFNVLLTPVGDANPEIFALEDWDKYDFSAVAEKEPVVVPLPTPEAGKEDVVVDKEYLNQYIEQAIKENTKVELPTTSNKVSMTFNPTDLKNADKIELNLTVNVVENVNDKTVAKNKKITDKNFVLKVEFSHEGKLPGEAVISIELPAAIVAQNLEKLYYYEILANGSLKYVCDAEIEGNVAKVKQDHCSDYVLLTEKIVDPANTGDSSNFVLWFALLALGAVAMAGSLVMRKRRF